MSDERIKRGQTGEYLCDHRRRQVLVGEEAKIVARETLYYFDEVIHDCFGVAKREERKERSEKKG